MTIDKQTLDTLYAEKFSAERFFQTDPCGIVRELAEHKVTQLDLELGALFVAVISWGNRKAIRTAARHMLADEMQWQPAAFVMDGRYEHSYADARNECVYRTLNVPTFKTMCQRIRQGIGKHDTMKDTLAGLSVEECIETIAGWLSPARLGTPYKSSCKRICMFLRWMIRHESPDFGLWRQWPQNQLYAVMDVHVCRLTAPILTVRQANWRACVQLTDIFRSWDAHDPLKYDIALMTLADNPPASAAF